MAANDPEVKENNASPEAEGNSPSQNKPELSLVENGNFVDEEFEPISYARAVEDPSIDNNYVKEMRDAFKKQQLHQIALAKLQQEEFSVERQAFYNEVTKIEEDIPQNEEEISAYLDSVIGSKESERILRDVAPSAYAAAMNDVNEYDIDADLEAAGIDKKLITPSLREELQISGAHAQAIGGKQGQSQFLEVLKSQKDNILKGLGDPKVSLAISGAMLGATVLAASNPIGITFAGIKFASKLLDTKPGQLFKEKLKESALGALVKMGVPREPVENFAQKVSNVVEKATNTKLGKVAIFGAGAATMAAVTMDFDSLVDKAQGKSLDDAVEAAQAQLSFKSDVLQMAAAEVASGATEEEIEAKAREMMEYSLSEKLDNAEAAFSNSDNIIEGAQAAYDQMFGDHVKNGWNAFEQMEGRSSELLVNSGAPYPAKLTEHLTAVQVAAGNAPDMPDVLYTIKQDDSLQGISESLLEAQGVKNPSDSQIQDAIDKIAEINNIKDPENISPGETLSFSNEFTPEKVVAENTPGLSDVPYTIKQGDTLWAISESLLEAKGIENPSNLQIQNAVNAIAEHNNIDNPDLIYAGKTMSFPTEFTPDKTEAVGIKPDLNPNAAAPGPVSSISAAATAILDKHGLNPDNPIVQKTLALQAASAAAYDGTTIGMKEVPTGPVMDDIQKDIDRTQAAIDETKYSSPEAPQPSAPAGLHNYESSTTVEQTPDGGTRTTVKESGYVTGLKMSPQELMDAMKDGQSLEDVVNAQNESPQAQTAPSVNESPRVESSAQASVEQESPKSDPFAPGTAFNSNIGEVKPLDPDKVRELASSASLEELESFKTQQINEAIAINNDRGQQAMEHGLNKAYSVQQPNIPDVIEDRIKELKAEAEISQKVTIPGVEAPGSLNGGARVAANNIAEQYNAANNRMVEINQDALDRFREQEMNEPSHSPKGPSMA